MLEDLIFSSFFHLYLTRHSSKIDITLSAQTLRMRWS